MFKRQITPNMFYSQYKPLFHWAAHQRAQEINTGLYIVSRPSSASRMDENRPESHHKNGKPDKLKTANHTGHILPSEPMSSIAVGFTVKFWKPILGMYTVSK